MAVVTLVAAHPARPLPWRGWLVDALVVMRLLARVRWTAETWVAVGALGLPALLLVRVLPRVGWTGWTGLRAGLVALGVMAVVGLAVSARGGGGAQAVSGRTCGPPQSVCPRVGGMGDDRWRASLHEAGHLTVGRHLGHRTAGAYINRDGSGGARVRWKGDLLHDLAMSMAGCIAERRSVRHYHGDGDQKQREHLLAGVPDAQRGRLESKAERLAKQKCRQLRGRIERTAEELYETGSVS